MFQDNIPGNHVDGFCLHSSNDNSVQLQQL